ncbi:Intersectin 1 (SH3 domain protein) [Parelaphostrongylus tenuis]|uniref:Intersectin 1 (SH3 domain protein) n=1 Tax=Parelaphostrongylus tenuis TaxID=148309 RepID=A0AAD5M662_PARTN|nr:Intersectin 1 (SH3 domain protein) [Parelaphostrongylus tenuis]
MPPNVTPSPSLDRIPEDTVVKSVTSAKEATPQDVVKVICTCVAQFPWKARNEGDLTFAKGDIIEIIEQQEMKWRGRKADGSLGWFPKSYVKPVVQETASASQPSSAAQSVDKVTTSTKGSPTGTVTPSGEKTTTHSENSSRQMSLSNSAHQFNVPKSNSNHSVSSQGSAAMAKLLATSASWYVAMFDFDAVEPTDLSLKVGDRIMVLERKDDWWRGRCNGREGIFPANYVQKCDTPSGVTIPIICRARAVADFEATAANQLSLRIGDVVSVREKSATGWWEGEMQRGGQTCAGWFPGDYVTTIPADDAHQNTATALFDYEAGQSDELSFRAGDVIVIVEKKDADWWAGHKLNLPNVRGLFPANYVQMRKESNVPNGFCPRSSFYEVPPNEELAAENLHAPPSALLTDNLYCSTTPGPIPVQHYDVPPIIEENSVQFNKLAEELLSTEERYLSDLLLAKKLYHDTLVKLPYRQQLEIIFLYWDQLVNVSKIIYARLKESDSPGHVFISSIDLMSVFVEFCSHQQVALDTLNDLITTHPDARALYTNCSASIAARGMTLSTFLLMPLGRVTRYPLLIEKILKESDPDGSLYQDLDTALQLLRALVSEVNQAVTEKENAVLLSWAQLHVKCPPLLRLEFTSDTRLMGPRSFLHSGVLYKQRSGRLLVALLFNDFLLLSTPDEHLSNPSSFKISKSSGVHLTLYKQPMLLSNLKVLPSNDETILNVKHGNDTICFRCVNGNARRLWMNQLEQAINLCSIMIMEQQQSQKSLIQTSAIGRLLVEVVNVQNISAKLLESPPHILRLSLGGVTQTFEVDLCKSTDLHLTTQFSFDDLSVKFSLILLQKNLYRPDVPVLG